MTDRMTPSSQPVQRRIKRGLLVLGIATLAATAAGAEPPAAPGALSHADVLWLERLSYGADAASAEHLRDVGRKRFLDEQLSGRNDVLPKAVQAQIDAMQISKTPAAKMLADEQAAQKRLRAMSDGDAKLDARKARNQAGNDYAQEAMRRHLLRAVYSPAQLKEQMDWFWLNHFSVFARKAAVRWLAADYEEHAIRPHALGKFRDLVMATLTHPAMLQYLDNAQNAAGHVNENYARELMELHTLGVDAGYSQHDVQELARVLTGVGVAVDANGPHRAGFVSDGLYAFYPARHDFGDKVLLGQTIHGRGFAEVEQAVDLLVKQPACARFVSRKLAQYFVADDPPAALVDAMTRTFQNSDGDIAQVLRTLFASAQFEASLGGKFKDPLHYVVSSVRLACNGGTIANQQPLLNWLNSQGEMLFGHQSPDGYALIESAWASSGQMSRRFETARAIGSNYANVLECVDNPRGDTPKLDNALFAAQLEPYLSAATRDALAQAKSPREWNAFLLASPEWNYR
jgi:uncharacterized protein (DUF1800 family)